MPVIFRNPEIKITSLSDIRELERVETEQLELPASTYELIANSAARFGERVALRGPRDFASKYCKNRRRPRHPWAAGGY